MNYPLKIQPIEFRDLLIEKCEWSKTEANEFVKRKLLNQFGEIAAEMLEKLEESE
jgi:hypothetical protein